MVQNVSVAMTCHLVNKTVVQQNCVETLNYHAQPPIKQAEAVFSILAGNLDIGRSK